jgi:hypothetical protein
MEKRAFDGTVLKYASPPLVEDFETWRQKQKGSAVEGSPALKWKSEPLACKFLSPIVGKVQLDRETYIRKRAEISSKWVK